MTDPQKLYGDPDLKIAGFSLWVHARQFPDVEDFWDGNWLYVTAELSAPGAVVLVEGNFVRNAELAKFRDELFWRIEL